MHRNSATTNVTRWLSVKSYSRTFVVLNFYGMFLAIYISYRMRHDLRAKIFSLRGEPKRF
jgi:hypothetical protein